MVRPLLGFHKAELEAYCQRSRLPYIVDPTNSELSYHRNRIRHVLRQMPSLADRSGGDNATGSSGGGSSSGGSERLAGTGAGRPAAPATIWQEEIEVPERGSGSSSSSDSSATGTGGSDGQSIVEDLLLLQRRCQAAGQQQQMLSDQVLQWAVLRTSCPDLPTRPREEQQAGQPLLVRPGREMSEAQLEAWRRRQQRRQAESAVRHAWRSQQPWFIDWDARLTLVRGPHKGLCRHSISLLMLGCCSSLATCLPACNARPPTCCAAGGARAAVGALCPAQRPLLL